MSYDAVLLDHDGVLVELLDRETLAAGLREHGTTRFRTLGVDPDPTVVDTLNVGAEADEIQRLADERGVDAGRLWHHRDEAIATTLREATRAGQKDPYDDVAALDRVDLPLGVVSNNQRRLVEFVLGEHGLADRFETVRARAPTLGSLDRRKPAPTYLEAAAADLGVDRPLYVGDSETDVVAAQRAGFDAAFLRRSHNTGRELSRSPTVEVTGLDEVVGLLDGARGQ